VYKYTQKPNKYTEWESKNGREEHENENML
jgi:hypothetical protein